MKPQRHFTNDVIKELSQRTVSGAFPVLLDFQHEDIKWGSDTNMENGHIRVINSPTSVWYKGDEDSRKFYASCSFSVTLPEENGKTVGDISVSVGFTDQTFINVIRSVSDSIDCKVVAVYQTEQTEDSETVYAFVPLKNYTLKVSSVTWSQSTATFKLVRDSIQNLKVPVDTAEDIQFPSIVEKN